MPAARLYGRVVDRASREPVAGAEVWVVTDRRREQLSPRDVVTDGEGRFALHDLPPGTLAVAARKARLVGESRMMAVAAAQAITDVEVEVDAGLAVRGQVVDLRGKGLDGVRLCLSKRNPPFDRSVWARSMRDGAFSLEGALPGEYALLALGDELIPTQTDLEVGHTDVDGVVVRLVPGAVVTGVVVAADGQPAGGAQIVAELAVGDAPGGGGTFVARGGQADRDGRFEIKGLEPSRVNLRAHHPQHGIGATEAFTVAAGEKRAVKVVLQSRGASIAGKVRYHDGRPAPGVPVAGLQRTEMGGFQNEEDLSAADGSFKLTGLGAGIVEVSAGRETVVSRESKTIVLAAEEQKTGIELELARGGLAISGRVLGPDGKPAVGASVSALPDHEGSSSDSRGRSYLTDGDGAFTIDDLDRGKYTIVAFHAGFPEAEAPGVDAGATNVRLQLAAGASVAGVVRGGDGRPVADYTIALVSAPGGDDVSADRPAPGWMASPADPVRRVHDRAGAFSFDHLKPGSYALKVAVQDGRSGSVLVTLRAAENRTGLRVDLASGVRIIGRVMDMDRGQPIAGAAVSATSVGPGSRPVSTTADGQGAFVLDGVPSDEAIQLFAAPDGYVPDGPEVEPPRGKSQIEVGAIKLIRGSVDDPGRHGVTGVRIASRDRRVLVAQVEPGMPADKAGIKPGDTILAIDGRDVRELGPTSLMYLMSGQPGSPVSVELRPPRGPAPRTVVVTRVAAGPSDF
jgi:hypothetical protein